ncbi:hypothetical protein X566_11180 [Afipia sp. P52-10]|uniref:hypothetical protein n=1 Tax=Afipia sp. P52-10 TaxID=1429916 RepID=UPI0003DF1EA2|nr:hypothetical protein [Afipia sp. P52-10]ETR78158.1 hypothetical protein X566_11180 [Afipia sp. P52-10]
MTEFLRLKQICLVAPSIEPAASDIGAVMGLDVCYRDPAVGAYGLENVLYPVDATLLEVVAPTREGTAAGRFLNKITGPGGQHGGYMVIFTCHDVERRREHAKAIGVRVAHVLDKPTFYGIQLHPADCRAAFVDFNRTKDSDGVFGPYTVAGPNWQDFIRRDTTQALVGIEVESPDPDNLADHWAKIIEVPVARTAGGEPALTFVNCTIRFVKGPAEVLGGLVFKVRDIAKVCDAAAARGYKVDGHSFHMCGVNFRLVA